MEYKSAKDILEDENFNPTQELVELAKALKSDYESIRKSNKKFDDNPDAKRMLALESNKLVKTNIEIIKCISDIKQKEDDLRLRLEELQDKRLERKQKELSEGGQVQKNYYIPAYGRVVDSDGKTKMVRIGQEDAN